jgi:hypothetical protein
LGLCQGSIATRRNVDLIVAEADDTMKAWKEEVEHSMASRSFIVIVIVLV